MADKKIGTVTHYFDKIGVAVLELTGKIKLEDQIKLVKGEEEFTQTVESIQIDQKEVKSGKKGDDIALKTKEPVKPGTQVFLI